MSFFFCDMKHLHRHFLFLVFLIISRVIDANERLQACSTLEACLKIISTPSDDDYKGIDKETQAVAKQLQVFGRASVKPLLKLLESPHESVRKIAGYTISDIKKLESDDLPYLVKAMQSGNGWVPTAIGRIGTQEAYRALVEDLRLKPETYTQTTGALKRGGKKSIPFLLEALSCNPDCPNAEFTQALAFVFDEMDAEADASVKPLLEIANDDNVKIELRLTAFQILKSIGPYVKGNSNTILLELKNHHNPKISEAATETLLEIGDPSAVNKLLVQLGNSNERDKFVVFKQLSTFGKAARSAGQKLESLVLNYEPSTSALAAETLGWIGYREATATLIKALKSQDWELVYYSAWSLGHLRATEAKNDLIQLSGSHWSYPVRIMAARAIEYLGKPISEFNPVEYNKVINNLDFLQRLIAKAPTCADKISWNNEQLKLESHKVLPPANVVRKIQKYIPDYAKAVFPVNKGWLITVSHGEFCGGVDDGILDCGLYFLNKKGKPYLISTGNFHGVYKTSSGLVATEGLDHLMFRSGHIYGLIQSNKDKWEIHHLAVIQAAPGKVALAKNGTLIIQTHGSVVALTDGGKLEKADCLDGM